jgi:hypothetical protein
MKGAIKSTPGNSPYFFPDTRPDLKFVLTVTSREANKPEYGQFYILEYAETTIKQLENQWLK